MEITKKDISLVLGGVLGAVMYTASIVAATREIQQWGLPVWAWGTIGFLVLEVCIGVMWYRHRKRMQFYEDRAKMLKERKGLEHELEKVTNMWVGMESGGHLSDMDDKNIKRITRILLLNPSSPAFTWLSGAPNANRDEMLMHVKGAIRRAKDYGIDIRLSSKAIQNCVIGDPRTPKTWVRVQSPIINTEPSCWPNYVVTRAEFGELVERIEDAYQALWDDEEDTKRPGEAGLG